MSLIRITDPKSKLIKADSFLVQGRFKPPVSKVKVVVFGLTPPYIMAGDNLPGQPFGRFASVMKKVPDGDWALLVFDPSPFLALTSLESKPITVSKGSGAVSISHPTDGGQMLEGEHAWGHSDGETMEYGKMIDSSSKTFDGTFLRHPKDEGLEMWICSFDLAGYTNEFTLKVKDDTGDPEKVHTNITVGASP